MNTVFGILIGLLVLMVLIVAHEFGHFLVAKKNGVRVKEFGVGFPPRATAWLHVPPKTSDGKWTWKKLEKKDWEKPQDSLVFSLNFIPVGGFCAMDGESDDDERKGTFGAASYWKKTKILFAGVAMNWLVAFLILTVLCWTGLPPILENQYTVSRDATVTSLSPVTVTSVLDGSPAEAAGFRIDDIILYVSEHIEDDDVVVINTYNDVIAFNNSHAGESVVYHIFRNNKTEIITVSLNSVDAEYILGVTMSPGSAVTTYTYSAPLVAAGLTVQLTGETFKGLWNLVVNLITGAARQVNLDATVREEGRAQISEATAGVSGIVGIIGGYFPGLVSAGPTYIFLFMAIISISLACMNVLPIPALDGGRWFMITVARLRGKKLSKEKEQKIVTRAFIFLLILMAVITVVDIIRLF